MFGPVVARRSPCLCQCRAWLPITAFAQDARSGGRAEQPDQLLR